MAVEATFIGLTEDDRGKMNSWAWFMARFIRKGGDYSDLLENVGIDSVTKTTDFLQKNKVKPKTGKATLLRRRKKVGAGGKRKRGRGRKTLIDHGIGWRQVAYKSDSDSVEVGVPDGYMAYHHEGRVPNAPQRPFLQMLTKDEVLAMVKLHWKEATK